MTTALSVEPIPVLLLKASFIRDLQVILSCDVGDRREEVRECRLSDYRAALSSQKDDTAEDTRRRASLLAEWERIFEVRGEFAEFEEEIEAAVFGDLPRREFERSSSGRHWRKVIIERDEANPDRCTVGFYRIYPSDVAFALEPGVMTHVSVPIFLQRLILKSGEDFLQYEFPKPMAHMAAGSGGRDDELVNAQLAEILREIERL